MGRGKLPYHVLGTRLTAHSPQSAVHYLQQEYSPMLFQIPGNIHILHIREAGFLPEGLKTVDKRNWWWGGGLQRNSNVIIQDHRQKKKKNIY